MTAPLDYRRQARQDVRDTYEQYELLQNGLGEQFATALNDRLDEIRGNAHLYGVFVRDIRAVKLRKFPQVVYYRILNGRVVVVAVLHGRRNPRRLRGRK